ncbi:laminarinase [Cyathus striatus]|nr:laminarinase [Cyathus striatus]
MNLSRLLSILISCAVLVNAEGYYISQNIVGTEFYNAFTFESIRDPTNGRAEYVNRSTARRLNLTYADEDTFILRADHNGVLKANGPGRRSVRIKSREWYTTHVAVFDIRHLPVGCASELFFLTLIGIIADGELRTWPAVWETDESTWPYGGEVDIVEGVNSDTPNAVTLHTGPGCVMPEERNETGTPTYLDCDAYANDNSGCGLFNSVGGGWYAIERQSSGIRVWFWSRDDSSVPDEVQYGYTFVNPNYWGIPAADFPSTADCNIDDHFSANNIIINLTLCGDWAGNRYVYDSSGCPSTCVDFVNNYPQEFVDAYFDFASVNVYLANDD